MAETPQNVHTLFLIQEHDGVGFCLSGGLRCVFLRGIRGYLSSPPKLPSLITNPETAYLVDSTDYVIRS